MGKKIEKARERKNYTVQERGVNEKEMAKEMHGVDAGEWEQTKVSGKVLN